MKHSIIRIQLKILMVVLSQYFPIHINAQIDTAWIKTWESGLWDDARALTIDSDNNIYLAGWNYEWGVNYDFVFIKYNENGDLLWSQTKDFASGDQASHIMIGPDGYLYVAGFVLGSYSVTGGFMCIMKYTLAGDSVWTFVDNNFSLTQISEMAFDNSGNIILAGFSGATLGNADYLTMKIDPDGNQLWYQTFNNNGPNQANRINGMCIDVLDNIYVTGSCDDSTFHSNVVTIKYSPDGESLWLRTFNAPSNDYDLGDKILLDPNGDLIIGGRINTSGPAQTDYMLLKYDTAGNLLWDKYFNYPGPQSFDIFKDLQLDEMGNIYLVGNSSTNNAQNTIRVETIKFNNDGDTVWTARWGTGSDFQPQQMVMDELNNIYITGYYYDANGGTGYNAFAIKYDSLGSLKWETTYHDLSNQEEEFNALALDENNDLIVTGRKHSETNFDFVTIKYRNGISGIPIIEKGNPNLQISCYPNPFSHSAFVNYYLPENSDAKIGVFDLLGKEVVVLASGKLQAGNHTLHFKADGLKAGIYFCRMETVNKIVQVKIVLIE